MFDVAIIGAGITGSMIARELSKYCIKTVVLEKENDVAKGATGANSGIVHAGFDAKPGSLKARFNVRGALMMEKVAKELGVPYKRNGALVIGFNEEDEKTINELYERGLENGVKDLKILSKEELKGKEPNISDDAICALYAPTSAIVCPYQLCIAAMGNAMDNGAELKTEFEVTDIKEISSGYRIFSKNEYIDSKYVINAAGVFGDYIAKLAGDESFSITARRGEYVLLDKALKNTVTHTIFTTPTKMGKGILVSPTADGNLLTGPTSEDIDEKENTCTTTEGLMKVMKEAVHNAKGVNYSKSITSFAGLRATGNTGDFIIKKIRPGFINVCGIESPGLSASPAIAEYVSELVFEDKKLERKKKENYISTRRSSHYFRDLPLEEKNEIIKKDPTFGQIVCRCEKVTKGEIIQAVITNPKPKDLDGIKRRTRARMGRCQGGFCSPSVMEILSEYSHTPFEKITKSGGDSYIVISRTKEAN